MYDIVIIGSGPAGLSAAIYAQRENLKAVVVEKEFMGTGQIAESEKCGMLGTGMPRSLGCGIISQERKDRHGH